MKIRLDVYLTERGYFESRNRAARAIENGQVSVSGTVITKPSYPVFGAEDIKVRQERFLVSRGYLKLEYALDAFGVSPSGGVAVDIGASAGGFTQCLLERGARAVFAVDSGKNQLHPILDADPRVFSMEKVNAKELTPRLFGMLMDLAVMDVSFISQEKLYPAVAGILKPGGLLIALIKPQFEAGRENIGKNGIVKDPDGKIAGSVKNRLFASALKCRLAFRAACDSPISGGDGNREYLALFEKI